MARADLLVTLIKANREGNSQLFRRTVEAIASEERARHHNVLADRLLEVLQQNGSHPRVQSQYSGSNRSFVQEVSPRRSFGDLVLLPDTIRVLERVTEEHHRANLLRSFNLEPRNRLLFQGPPGNGKTSAAEALATALMVPLLVVQYERIIGSYLGETAQRLGELFDYVRSRQCVLFLDEFDVLGKERGDVHETGEIKRVVSSLLLQIDDLPSYVVVVTATNHPELLDRAVWRRFQVHISFPPPTARQVSEWIGRFCDRLPIEFRFPQKLLSGKLNGLSFSDLENFGADVMRSLVLDSPNPDIMRILTETLALYERRQGRAEPRIG